MQHPSGVIHSPSWSALLFALACVLSIITPNALAQQPAAERMQSELQELCPNISVPPPINPAQEANTSWVGPVLRVPVGSGEMAYIRFGNTSSSLPPLVLIPGIGNTISGWPVDFLRSLAERQEVIAIDHVGQGFSSPPATSVPFTISSMANDVSDLIKALNLQKPNVMGRSLGGMVASALLGNHSNEIGAVIVAHGSAGGAGSTPPLEEAAKLVDPNSSLRDTWGLLYDLETENGRQAACEAYSKRLATMGELPQAPSNTSNTLLQAGATFQWFLGRGAWEELVNVTNPVLLVGGLDDRVVPADNLKAMAGRLPVSWLAMFPGRHAAIVQWQEVFFEVLDSFMSVWGSPTT